jgi:DNA-binding transcriptional ArsR family regulator
MPARRSPKPAAGLAARIDELARRVSALERPKTSRPARTASALDSDDLLKLLERRRAAAPKDRRGRSGVVSYGGSVGVGTAEYLWAIERPATSVLDGDLEIAAHVLATLGNPQRLRLLVALVERPRTAAELQKIIASKSPGPLYHHLRDLLALGVVAQRDRRYVIPARHVVPLLTALTLTVDLDARREA